ncbi:MAG: DinB family protein [Phycisphaeraceae bacterium]|nr:DinB family protein [Phycisphaeraceae bacterium]
MKPTEALAANLDSAFLGKGWHGPTFLGSLRGVSPAEALQQPKNCAHSLWDLLLHTTYWKYTILVRLGVAEPNTFPRSPSNWPKTPDRALPARELARVWKADLKLAREMHARLKRALSTLAESQLDRIPPGGKSWTARQLISGIAAHDVYHAGQAQLIKKMIRR